MPKYDTSEPILVLIRRGRKGRGFSISPVEDLSNASACATAADIGEVIEEMLDDESQPRVNINELLRASTENVPVAADSSNDDGDDDDDEPSNGGGNGRASEDGDGIFDGVAGSDNPADRIMFNIFSSVIKKGRDMSTKRVRSETITPGKKRKAR